jgi:hypothetical protein
MTARADNQQLGFEIAREIDNISHGMSHQDVCLDLHVSLFGHRTRPIRATCPGLEAGGSEAPKALFT